MVVVPAAVLALSPGVGAPVIVCAAVESALMLVISPVAGNWVGRSVPEIAENVRGLEVV
jgi:hypothetical protein